ncbi:hypothetical protein Ahia01_001204200, partial [Argonauta hians]
FGYCSNSPINRRQRCRDTILKQIQEVTGSNMSPTTKMNIVSNLLNGSQRKSSSISSSSSSHRSRKTWNERMIPNSDSSSEVDAHSNRITPFPYVKLFQKPPSRINPRSSPNSLTSAARIRSSKTKHNPFINEGIRHPLTKLHSKSLTHLHSLNNYGDDDDDDDDGDSDYIDDDDDDDEEDDKDKDSDNDVFTDGSVALVHKERYGFYGNLNSTHPKPTKPKRQHRLQTVAAESGDSPGGANARHDSQTQSPQYNNKNYVDQWMNLSCCDPTNEVTPSNSLTDTGYTSNRPQNDDTTSEEFDSILLEQQQDQLQSSLDRTERILMEQERLLSTYAEGSEMYHSSEPEDLQSDKEQQDAHSITNCESKDINDLGRRL